MYYVMQFATKQAHGPFITRDAAYAYAANTLQLGIKDCAVQSDTAAQQECFDYRIIKPSEDQPKTFVPLISKWYFLSPGQWKIINGVKIENTTNQLLRVQLTVAEHYVGTSAKQP